MQSITLTAPQIVLAKKAVVFDRIASCFDDYADEAIQAVGYDFYDNAAREAAIDVCKGIVEAAPGAATKLRGYSLWLAGAPGTTERVLKAYSDPKDQLPTLSYLVWQNSSVAFVGHERCWAVEALNQDNLNPNDPIIAYFGTRDAAIGYAEQLMTAAGYPLRL